MRDHDSSNVDIADLQTQRDNLIGQTESWLKASLHWGFGLQPANILPLKPRDHVLKYTRQLS